MVFVNTREMSPKDTLEAIVNYSTPQSEEEKDEQMTSTSQTKKRKRNEKPTEISLEDKVSSDDFDNVDKLMKKTYVTTKETLQQSIGPTLFYLFRGELN